MRIGIDARVLQTPLKNYGIGVYSYNLIKNIIETDNKLELIFYVWKNESIPSIIEPYEKVYLNRYRRANFIWQQFIELNTKCDIFHMLLCLGPSLEIILPIIQFKKTIATIYDLILYKLKDNWSEYIKNTKEYKLQIYALKKVKKIITLSYYTKKDLIDTFSLPDDKIEIVYPGVSDDIFKPNKDVNKFTLLRKKYNITKKFILCVGSDYKKNIPTTLKVIKELKDMQLVIVGDKVEDKLIKDLQLDEKVIFVKITFPSVEDLEDLVLLYSFAEVLLFPSIAEGFGIPIIEAMACGCPIIASNAWSLPEVVDDAGIILSPYDVKGMIDSINAIINNKEFRNTLINKGLNRVKKFSWKESAKKLINLYEEIIF